jgi:hypothetical protein
MEWCSHVIQYEPTHWYYQLTHKKSALLFFCLTCYYVWSIEKQLMNSKTGYSFCNKRNFTQNYPAVLSSWVKIKTIKRYNLYFRHYMSNTWSVLTALKFIARFPYITVVCPAVLRAPCLLNDVKDVRSALVKTALREGNFPFNCLLKNRDKTKFYNKSYTQKHTYCQLTILWICVVR